MGLKWKFQRDCLKCQKLLMYLEKVRNSAIFKILTFRETIGLEISAYLLLAPLN